MNKNRKVYFNGQFVDEKEAKQMMGKILITHQTGPEGKEVKRLYIEEASDKVAAGHVLYGVKNK